MLWDKAATVTNVLSARDRENISQLDVGKQYHDDAAGQSRVRYGIVVYLYIKNEKRDEQFYMVYTK